MPRFLCDFWENITSVAISPALKLQTFKSGKLRNIFIKYLQNFSHDPTCVQLYVNIKSTCSNQVILKLKLNKVAYEDIVC